MSKQITVAEAIELCKSIKPESCYDEDLFEELNISEWDVCIEDWEQFSKTVYQKYFDSWTCWDTRVGKYIIYLNDEPVCIAAKSARKAQTYFYWLSKEQMLKTREYFLSLVHPTDNSEEYKIIYSNSLIDLEGEDIGNSRSAQAFCKG